MKPSIRVVCHKCGAVGQRDPDASSASWAVYKSCPCGGHLQAEIVAPEPKTDTEVDAYLRSEGLDPVAIGKQGTVFVKTVQELVLLRAENSALRAENVELSNKLAYKPTDDQMAEQDHELSALRARLTIDDVMVERAARAYNDTLFDDVRGPAKRWLREVLEAALKVNQ